MTTTKPNGRLCNQIIRNLCVSIIAEKQNLFVTYSSYDRITLLGIPLFIGTQKYDNTIILTDDNFFDILYSLPILQSNLNPNDNYFQTKTITNYLDNYLHQSQIKQKIINMNPFKERYMNNNDCFIHIRLTDCERHNPGLLYYLKVLEQITFDKLYIASDDINHHIIKSIAKKYAANVLVLNCDEIKTIQFGSTTKHIILSHGSFSAMIGYLAFYSQIYYSKYDEKNIWYGDMFSIPGWKQIE